MSRLATLKIHQDGLAFAAGHFTIFSATERENLHGHNYSVSAAFEVVIGDNGMAFDYRYYRNKLLALTSSLDRNFLLPTQSLYLRLEETDDHIIGHFNGEKIYFLKREVMLLPVTNVTIEEMSLWFLQQITPDQQELKELQIQKVVIGVFNGPGQSGTAIWTQDKVNTLALKAAS